MQEVFECVDQISRVLSGEIEGCVLNQDCLEVLPTFPDGCVRLLWTDPPYGHSNMEGDLQAARVRDGVKGARVRDVEPIVNDGQDDMRASVDAMMAESPRILARDCCCCCCCAGGGGPSPTFGWLALRMDEGGMEFFHAVVWDKSARGNGMGWRYRRNYEFVLVAHRKGGRLSWSNPSLAVPNIVRFMPVLDRVHPNEKPLELVAHFIQLHTHPGDLILDPFCGSGTTLVAAKKLDRKFIGIDISPEYCEIARARLRAVDTGVSVKEARAGQLALPFGG